ncbi:MAG: class I SAM-dependent DNA methyltransferase, partial [Deferrisomatales bacterium]
MNPAQFIAKWRQAELTERSAAQQHFLDLCELVDHPKPAEADPQGSWFTFERGAAKRSGGDGWADVWKRGFFGWEYKGRHKDLNAAYDQLLQYREALENPPLLVVCDLARLVVHTNFTATAPAVHVIELADLGSPRSLEILRAVFHAPERLKPGATSETITRQAAEGLAGIAEALRGRGLEPHRVARFLDRLVFCLFAEDIGLLPEGLFTRLLDKTHTDPARFGKLASQLFAAMATGGDFGLDSIRRFNGNLFDAADAQGLDLTPDELDRVLAAARLEWSAVDPSIFGTLFVRGLDPGLRAQLGAQYTSREDIETLVDPVVMAPLRREWAETRALCDGLLVTGRKTPRPSAEVAAGAPLPPAELLSTPARAKARGEATSILHRFLMRLAGVKVLDPACGSGNFLYVTLQKLKDLEKEVLLYTMEQRLGAFLPMVGPWQLYGLEVSPYAHELAQMTVWIGYLQWTRANGFGVSQDPVLRPMDRNFLLLDAILDLTDPDLPKEPEWPAAEFIVGNPPFLGNKRMRSELGADYCGKLWAVYGDRLPAMSDLCCYWFEKARAQIEMGRCHRAGLLATTGIRQVGARRVLERIAATADVFFAVSDRDWVLDGASVRISMVGFGRALDGETPVLDGVGVAQIHADLTSGPNINAATRLGSNLGRCFMGTTKVGAFDIPEELAVEFLHAPNPNGRPNSDVVRPFRNGSDLVRAPSHRWIVDFGVNRPLAEACLYEGPFEYVVAQVKPERERNNDSWRRANWWLLGRSIAGFRNAVAGGPCYLATP